MKSIINYRGWVLVTVFSVVLLAAVGVADEPARDVTLPQSVQQQLHHPACPQYALRYDYSGWINLQSHFWTFQPGDPVEVIQDDPNGDLTSLALLQIDMRGYTKAEVVVYYDNPTGWVTNLGNSPTNNGCGGDSGTNSFDSEFWAVNLAGFEYDLGATTNDYAHQAGFPSSMYLHDLWNWWCWPWTCVTYIVEDGSLYVSKKCCFYPLDAVFDELAGEGLFQHDESVQCCYYCCRAFDAEFTGQGVFQLDGWDNELGGCNDKQLWLGLNHVVKWTTDRQGQGAEWCYIHLIGLGPEPVPHQVEVQ
ncbi:MAG: hypothetical protein KAY37_06345 [Phycisphaerae bacterium]|nr:hypothetical protein [Phycisphaerae bacterium]